MHGAALGTWVDESGRTRQGVRMGSRVLVNPLLQDEIPAPKFGKIPASAGGWGIRLHPVAAAENKVLWARINDTLCAGKS